MKFIEMTGKELRDVVNENEMNLEDLRAAGVTDDSVVRINEQGDIEVRRANGWDVIGGLLGNYEQRIKRRLNMDWA